MSTQPSFIPKPWPFDQPTNCASITLRQIMNGRQPILSVSHDADDGGWQFLGGGSFSAEDAAVVSLMEMAALDPTLLELADLPPGWHAWRGSVKEPWRREPTVDDGCEGDPLP